LIFSARPTTGRHDNPHAGLQSRQAENGDNSVETSHSTHADLVARLPRLPRSLGKASPKRVDPPTQQQVITILLGDEDVSTRCGRIIRKHGKYRGSGLPNAGTAVTAGNEALMCKRLDGEALEIAIIYLGLRGLDRNDQIPDLVQAFFEGKLEPRNFFIHVERVTAGFQQDIYMAVRNWKQLRLVVNEIAT